LFVGGIVVGGEVVAEGELCGWGGDVEEEEGFELEDVVRLTLLRHKTTLKDPETL